MESVAVCRGRDLDAEGVAILPMGGAHGITRYLTRFGPKGADIQVVGLCDANEQSIFQRGLTEVRYGRPKTRADMERLGFYVCVEDLEDELISALGPTRIEVIFDSQGDLGSFRTLQMQPGWRDRKVEDQMRRFLGSGARRKLRYARLLVGSVDLDRVPHPLDALLAEV